MGLKGLLFGFVWCREDGGFSSGEMSEPSSVTCVIRELRVLCPQIARPAVSGSSTYKRQKTASAACACTVESADADERRLDGGIEVVDVKEKIRPMMPRT